MPVINHEKESTKCRVVFLANLCEKGPRFPNAISHNQAMHAGPPLNQKISSASNQLRFGKFILCFDLVKAFNQIKLSESDSSKLLFLWFKNPLKGDFTLQAYRNVRLSFGLKPAPMLLMTALFKILVVDAQNDPEELRNLKSTIYQLVYMDNTSIAADTEEKIIQYYNQLNNIFEPYGFKLQQFFSNSKLCQSIIDEETSLNTPNMVTVLGMQWDRSTDQFSTKNIKLDPNANTKKLILKTIASQYDVHNSQWTNS